jgi:gas vesicle protein
MEASQTGATGQAQEKAQQVAGQAQEKVQEAAGQAKGQLRTQVDQRSTQAGEQISTQASDIRTVAQQLREQGKDQPAKIAEQAADRVERVGGYLKQSDADRILSDIEDFGRRQPLAILFGGLALGFAASRVLKASSQQRYEQGGRYAGPTSGAYRPGYERPTAHLEPPAVGVTGAGPAVAPPSTVPPPRSPGTTDPTRVDPTVSPTGGVIR